MSCIDDLHTNWSQRMPMKGKLPAVAARIDARAPKVQSAWLRFLAVISNQDLQFVVGFCAAGILLTLDAILQFPDFGASLAALATFP
jgi:hypothetical protein